MKSLVFILNGTTFLETISFNINIIAAKDDLKKKNKKS
jgi:hypothetical protein